MASPKLTPVAGDPFAAPAAKRPKLTPVSGDPFAAPTRRGPAPPPVERVTAPPKPGRRNELVDGLAAITGGGNSLGFGQTHDTGKLYSTPAQRAAPGYLVPTVRKAKTYGERVATKTGDGLRGIATGLARVAAATLPEGEAQAALNRMSDTNDAISAQPIEGATSFEDVNSAGSLGKFIAEEGPASLVQLPLLASGPGVAAYIASLTGNIGQQRAANDGYQHAGLGDLAVAAPAAAASAALDRFGIGKVLGATGRNAAVRIGKAALSEAGTEGAQSAIEYTGGTLGTDTGMDAGDLGQQVAAGAILGGAMGGGIHGGVELLPSGNAAPAPVAEELPAPEMLAAPEPAPAAIAPPAPVLTPVEGDPFQSAPVAAPAPAPRQAAPQPIATTPATAGSDGLGQAATPEPAAPTPEPASKLEPARPRRFNPDDVPVPAPAAAEPAPLRPEPGDLAEGERLVRTPAGASLRTKLEVVDASTLAQAEGANQNRDRSRDTTTLQVQDIIAKFDPEALHEDPSSDRGAPIVGDDNAIDSGNGRMLALNAIYDGHPELAAKYRAMIEGRGFSTEGMERPVLVQRRMTPMTPEQRRQFVIDSNKDTKLELSPVERARSDADAITPEMLATYAGGDLNSTANAGFVQSFNSRLTAGEMGNMVGSDRRLTPAGAQRIENAVVAHAYGEPKLLERMMESSHDEIRSITGSLADVAGPWARLRDSVKSDDIDASLDITKQLVDAAARVADARKRGIKPADLLTQADAFDPIDPVTAELIRGFHNAAMTRSASRKAVSTLLQDYITEAQSQDSGPGLFGETEVRSPQSIIKDLLEQRDNPNGAGLALEPKEITDASTGTPEGLEGRDNGRSVQGQRNEEEGDGRARSDADPQAKPRSEGRGRAARADESLEVGDEDLDYTEGRDAGLQLDKGAYDPDFATASFTNRTSIFNSAAEAMGIDPDKFTLMPAPKQVELLQAAVRRKYGVTVLVDRGMQERFAIDQMLDAYQNLQGMAHVLDLPERAISLQGSLRIKLQKGGNFLGAFSPGQNLIMLPKRTNSFAHEWGHALDWHLLGNTDQEGGRGLSGMIRKRGEDADTIAPATVREAFVDLLNAMFFDKAGFAAKLMSLEAQRDKSNAPKTKADLQAQIDRLIAGNSQARGIDSNYRANAKTIGGSGDYWTSPTEMLARAFEAFVSYKVEAAGLTTEFLGKGDAGYLSNAEERFAKTFPKDQERAEIFAAFEHLFGNIAHEAILADGPAATVPAGTTRKITDYDKTPAVKKERGVLKRELSAIRQAVTDAKKAAAQRVKSPKGVIEQVGDLNGATFMSMTGNLRMIQARSGSPALQQLIDLLTKQDGRGDRTVGRTFAEGVHLRSKRGINRLSNILKANGLDKRTADDDMMLRDLLIGERTDGPANFVKAAAAIRHLLDEEFYVNQRAGIDLGYTRSGYLARVLDLPKVYDDQPGFLKAAAEVYKIVFDKAFGTDFEAIMANDDLRPRFLRLAGFLAKKGHDIPTLPEVRELLKKLNRLAAKAAKSDEPDKFDEEIAKLTEELNELGAQLLDEVRPAYASERAEAWLAKINLTAGEEHNAASPDSKYTKHRDLPPEADKIMEQFYLSDPVESVTNYLNTSARRTAYAERFGADGKKRKALFEAMAKEGVGPDDQRTVARILDIATGRVRSEMPRSVQKALAFVNAAGTMALLPRATISSLAEPFTSGLVTGNALHGFKTVALQIGQALGSPSGKTRAELARAMGIITDLASDNIMEARYGQTYADETRWDRYTATMFRRTGLTGLTRSQKTAGIGMGHAFLDNLAQKIMAGDNGPVFGHSVALMRELGVRDPLQFSEELLARNAMPTVEDLDTAFGHDYTTAQLRYSRLTVQEPDAMDRPELAHNPAGRVIYGITGFSYSYWRNIIKRNGILLSEKAKTSPFRAALYGGQLFAAAAVAFMMGAVISTIREKLLNPKRWAELEAKGELDSTMLQLAFTRTFSFGAADVAIQTWSGLKYQRDLSNAFVGAGPGFFLQNTQKIAPLVPTPKLTYPFINPPSQSRKTNTAEYNAVQGAYSTASPFLAFGLARIPGGPIVDVMSGAGMAYLTSPNARDAVATAVVGPKNTAKVRTPTALDKRLDEAFGPVERKKRE